MRCSYLSKYADPTDEPVSTPYDQSFEDMDLTVDNWKRGWFDVHADGSQTFWTQWFTLFNLQDSFSTK